jgi:Pyridoxamine 5'-phosphate oxidase
MTSAGDPVRSSVYARPDLDLGGGRRSAGGRAHLLAWHHDRVGRPHAAPVWGVVTGGTLYLYSERRTVKARNLAVDPRVVLHLESGEDVLIVYGVAEDLGAPGDVPSVVAALAAKYTRPEDRQYLPDADPGFDVVYALRPRSALAWRLDDYTASQRRWSFGS